MSGFFTEGRRAAGTGQGKEDPPAMETETAFLALKILDRYGMTSIL